MELALSNTQVINPFRRVRLSEEAPTTLDDLPAVRRLNTRAEFLRGLREIRNFSRVFGRRLATHASRPLSLLASVLDWRLKSLLPEMSFHLRSLVMMSIGSRCATTWRFGSTTSDHFTRTMSRRKGERWIS